MKNRFNKAPTETKSLFDLLTHKYIALGAPLPYGVDRQRGTPRGANVSFMPNIWRIQ